MKVPQAATLVDNMNINVADVETVSIKVDDAVTVDLSGLSMTAAGKTMGLTLTGTAGLGISALGTDVTTINASGKLAGGVVQTGRSTTGTVEYTGGAGADTFIMTNLGDTLVGGKGSDTLDLNYAAILGGINVNLASATNQIVSANGSAISGSVTGFENVDLSGYTGTFGALITSGSNVLLGTTAALTGTLNADQINLSSGVDTIVVPSKTPTGADVVNSFTVGAGKDKIDVAALAEADFDTAGANIAATTGFVVLGAAGDVVASLTANLATAELAAYDGSIGASEEFFFAVDDGVSTGIFFFADGNGDATADAGESVHIMTLVGITDATTVIAANVGL